jgi:hypothetical protein
MPHKTTVNFSDQAWRMIEDCSNETGASMSEVLRRALAWYRWSLEVRASGGHILIERDGKFREVISV